MSPGRGGAQVSRFVDFRSWPGWVWQNPLAFLTTLLAGAALSFGYSYVPLHASKMWKIDYLEERVAGLNRQLRHAEVKLSQAEATARALPGDDDLKKLRSEIDKLKKEVAAARKEAGSFESQVAKLERSRDDWKSQHARAVAELDEIKSRRSEPRPTVAGDPWDGPATPPVGLEDSPLYPGDDSLPAALP